MKGNIPVHIGIIMDGNGRWAKARLLPRAAGHRAGMKRMMGLVEHIFASGVCCCTVFALSAENLRRPKEELEELFSLFREYFSKNVYRLKENGIALKTIGDLTLLPPDLQELIGKAKEDSSGEKTLVLALAYGGRQDILSACNEAVRRGQIVTEQTFASMLSTGGMPALDLLIRTGREKRLSNFLLYEAAYAELLFSDKLFPDFSDKDFDAALEEYAARDRRFGKLGGE